MATQRISATEIKERYYIWKVFHLHIPYQKPNSNCYQFMALLSYLCCYLGSKEQRTHSLSKVVINKGQFCCHPDSGGLNKASSSFKAKTK